MTLFSPSQLKLLFFPLVFLCMLAPLQVFADLKPFIQATNVTNSDMDATVSSVQDKLRANGFQVVGAYQPNELATVIIVTNSTLQKIAAKSTHGGFGAMQRVAVVSKDKAIQVSYTNPEYFWNAYRMQGNIMPVTQALETALGHINHLGQAKVCQPRRYVAITMP